MLPVRSSPTCRLEHPRLLVCRTRPVALFQEVLPHGGLHNVRDDPVEATSVNDVLVFAASLMEAGEHRLPLHRRLIDFVVATADRTEPGGEPVRPLELVVHDSPVW